MMLTIEVLLVHGNNERTTLLYAKPEGQPSSVRIEGDSMLMVRSLQPFFQDVFGDKNIAFPNPVSNL